MKTIAKFLEDDAEIFVVAAAFVALSAALMALFVAVQDIDGESEAA